LVPPVKLVVLSVKVWPTQADGMVAVGVLSDIALPTTSIVEALALEQPLLSVTVAVYLNCDVFGVAPVMEAVVLGLVVLEVGFTVVLPGATTTEVLHA